jgi:hypothetical protein
MATIKASNQISLTDLTDAYSVILSSDSCTFVGNTTSVNSTQIMKVTVTAMRGADIVACTVGDMTYSTSGISATASTATSPVVTITASTSLKAAGTITIPVTITDADVTINKIFNFAIAFTGAKGSDAITMSITSSNGFVFKNTSVNTTLTAHVYQAGKELTSSTSPTLASVGTIKWYKDGGTTAVGTGQTLTVTSSDVTDNASYTAQLEA